MLDQFERFCKVDLALADSTVWRAKYEMKRLLDWLEGRSISKDLLRRYLEPFNVEARNNALRSFRRFFRDFLLRPNFIMSFKFVKTPPKLVLNLPSREELKKAYNSFEKARDQALFLLYASSGLRRQELLDLTFQDVDFDRRMLVPNHNSRTKCSYITFYNEEAEQVLQEYLEQNQPGSRLFPVSPNAYLKAERKAYMMTGVRANPQLLREWFCSEMGRLGVPDRYIDAFCGRVPRSILARHYTDYSAERLEEIYDKANLKVLA